VPSDNADNDVIVALFIKETTSEFNMRIDAPVEKKEELYSKV